MDRRLYWIWLQRSLPLGSIAIDRLFERFEDIEDVYAAGARALSDTSLRPSVQQRLLDKSLDEAEHILEAVNRVDGWVLTPDDTRYPDLLRQIVGFPAVLYGQGSMPDLNTLPVLAVVGTRHAANEGIDNTFRLAAGLAAAGMVIVSGGARGCDAAAHEGALAAGGQTVLVKAAPPDVEYPPQNAGLRRRIVQAGGAVVTEYPPGQPFYCNYHIRNRLISGMSLGVCVTEARLRSGALITANLARDQGREVFAIPGNTADHNHDGAHHLIRKGGILVTKAADILEEYVFRYPGLLDAQAAAQAEQRFTHILPSDQTAAPHPPVSPQPRVADAASEADSRFVAGASPGAERLYALLTEQPCPIDELAERAQMNISEALVLLTELELLGCVRCTAGQQYCRL